MMFSEVDRTCWHCTQESGFRRAPWSQIAILADSPELVGVGRL